MSFKPVRFVVGVLCVLAAFAATTVAVQATTQADTVYACVKPNGTIKKLKVNAEPNCNNGEIIEWTTGGAVSTGGIRESQIALPPFTNPDEGPADIDQCLEFAVPFYCQNSSAFAVSLDTTRYEGATFVLKPVLYGGCVRLFDLSSSTAIAGSEVCAGGNTPASVSSAEFSMTGGELELVIQFRVNAEFQGDYLSAMLIARS